VIAADLQASVLLEDPCVAELAAFLICCTCCTSEHCGKQKGHAGKVGGLNHRRRAAVAVPFLCIPCKTQLHL
jgi:hypothetical protein